MSMTFNQFQKELTNRGIDPQTAYMLSVVFEIQIEQGKQLDACASIIEQLVGVVQNFTQLHGATQQKLTELMRRAVGEVEGVTVTSEPMTEN